MKKKICIVTGTRAEYGLLRWLMQDMQSEKGIELQIVVTGMHLSPEFGLTYKLIEEDGFCICKKLDMLLSSDSPEGIAKSMGLGIIGFADIFAELKPDLLLILGDRFEIFSAASAAMIAKIPIAHLHGGESTEGLIDEAIRHSITKMSHLHFVATEEYAKRVIQLGESPEYVFNVGSLGVDGISRLPLLGKKELEKGLGLKFGAKNLLVTFHPVTLEVGLAQYQMQELLTALSKLDETTIIFTLPNADPDGRVLIEMIRSYANDKRNVHVFPSLGQQRYLSCMACVDGVIGNSSSGLIEAPSLRRGTVNIGDRQRGRTKADSVIDCDPNSVSITNAIDKLYSHRFQNSLALIQNPYGVAGAAKKIITILNNTSLDNLLKKKFYTVVYK